MKGAAAPPASTLRSRPPSGSGADRGVWTGAHIPAVGRRNARDGAPLIHKRFDINGLAYAIHGSTGAASNLFPQLSTMLGLHNMYYAHTNRPVLHTDDNRSHPFNTPIPRIPHSHHTHDLAPP